jgi:hypothetical protein
LSKISEHSIQASLIRQLAYSIRPEVVRFAIPNGGLRNFKVAQKLKAEGVLPGIPDLGFAVEDGKACWLELKTDKGRLSDAQMGIRFKLEALGHRWALARSVEEAMGHLKEWGILA